MLADWAVDFARRSARARQPIWIAAVSVLVVYVTVLMNLQSLWHDEVALISGRLTRFPESAYCHKSLARALTERGDKAGAQRELEAAAKLPAGS
jgi:hypothetical protein